jgi:hypothetical protein
MNKQKKNKTKKMKKKTSMWRDNPQCFKEKNYEAKSTKTILKKKEEKNSKKKKKNKYKEIL